VPVFEPRLSHTQPNAMTTRARSDHVFLTFFKFGDGSGSKIFELGLVGSIYCWVWFSHLWFGPGFWKINPKNPKFFPLDKNLSSDWVKKYPGQRRVGLLFTAGQTYAHVGSGQCPSLLKMYSNTKHFFT